MIDYKEKIRKLLALAESPVEAEARAALLKDRQLMAEHKLTEAFKKAGTVLRIMKRLAEEAEQRVVE